MSEDTPNARAKKQLDRLFKPGNNLNPMPNGIFGLLYYEQAAEELCEFARAETATLQAENERLTEALKNMKGCFAVIDCEDCTAVIARALEEPTE